MLNLLDFKVNFCKPRTIVILVLFMASCVNSASSVKTELGTLPGWSNKYQDKKIFIKKSVENRDPISLNITTKNVNCIIPTPPEKKKLLVKRFISGMRLKKIHVNKNLARLSMWWKSEKDMTLVYCLLRSQPRSEKQYLKYLREAFFFKSRKGK